MTEPASLHTSRWRGTWLLDRVAALIAVAAVLVLLMPPAAPDRVPSLRVLPDAAPTAVPPVATAERAADVAVWRSTIIHGNLFSPTRSAPVSAFVMLGTAPAPTALLTAETAPGLSTTASTNASADRYPQLVGIIARDGEWFALVQLTARDDSPRLYRAGDRRAGFLIRRVTATAVDLAGPGGSQRLTLRTRTASDSSPTFP